MDQQETIPSGPAAAAVLAAGAGSLTLGLLTTLAATSSVAAEALNFYEPVGSLSGKTTVAVVVWLLAWAALNGRWKRRQVDFPRAFVTTLLLIAAGLVGTFPPFWELFQ